MSPTGLFTQHQHEHFAQQIAAYTAQRDQLLERINTANDDIKRMEQEVERLEDILTAYDNVVKPELDKYERVHK
jgi:chromosome segregation ATPase